MPVSNDQEAALRALLGGNPQRAASLAEMLPGEDMPTFELLLQAAVVLTARRRFTPGCKTSDIVRYVARLRTILATRPNGPSIDPRAAEAVLFRALGMPAAGGTDTQAQLVIVPALLTALASDLALASSDINEIVNGAEAMRYQWRAAQRAGL